MKVYLAARYSRYPEMRLCAGDLRRFGIEVTSRWILGDHDIGAYGQAETSRYAPLWAQEDFDDLVAADVCISFTEGKNVPGRARGGRHVELGLALAFKKRVIVVGLPEHVFHYLPQIEYFSCWVECFRELIEENARPLNVSQQLSDKPI